MQITIYQPECFTEVGRRSNNEDSIYPLVGNASPNNNLFLVCDGVGGMHKGEIASALVCEGLSHFFEQNNVGIIDKGILQDALQVVKEILKKTETENPATIGMATTLTLLQLNEKGVTLAHVGDSRIYQLRNGLIIHKTDDHSLVNELVKQGKITSEEALTHSLKNQITRAIGANRNDEPEVIIIEDIQQNDYFFLCTDGVLEHVYDELLEYHLRTGEDNQILDSEKMKNIKYECEEKTRDNFSAYLIHIASINNTNIAINSSKTQILTRNEQIIEHRFSENITNEIEFAPKIISKQEPIKTISLNPNHRYLRVILILVGIIAIVGILKFIFFDNNEKKASNISTRNEENQIFLDSTQNSVVILPEKEVAKYEATALKPQKNEGIISVKFNRSFIREGKQWFLIDENKTKHIIEKFETWKSYHIIVYSINKKQYNVYLEQPDKFIFGLDDIPKINAENEIILKKAGKSTIINTTTGKVKISNQENDIQKKHNVKSMIIGVKSKKDSSQKNKGGFSDTN
jgi:PPM family protein phosphatase